MAGHVVAVGLGAELVVAHRTAGADAHLLGSGMNGRVLYSLVLIRRSVVLEDMLYFF